MCWKLFIVVSLFGLMMKIKYHNNNFKKMFANVYILNLFADQELEHHVLPLETHGATNATRP